MIFFKLLTGETLLSPYIRLINKIILAIDCSKKLIVIILFACLEVRLELIIFSDFFNNILKVILNVKQIYLISVQ